MTKPGYVLLYIVVNCLVFWAVTNWCTDSPWFCIWVTVMLTGAFILAKPDFKEDNKCDSLN